MCTWRESHPTPLKFNTLKRNYKGRRQLAQRPHSHSAGRAKGSLFCLYQIPTWLVGLGLHHADGHTLALGWLNFLLDYDFNFKNQTIKL